MDDRARTGFTERKTGIGIVPIPAPRSVLGRGLLILGTVGEADHDLRMSEIAERTNLAQPTTYRLLNQLVGWGALDKSGRHYRIGRRLFELGAGAPRERRLRDLALPYMEDLHAATRGLVHLAVIDGGEVLYLERLAGHDAAPSPSRVGGRSLAHCTGVGRAILAFSDDWSVIRAIARGLEPRPGQRPFVPELFIEELKEIRRVGVACDPDEIKSGVGCVAAPILNAQGEAVAGISVSDRISSIDTTMLAPALRTAARSIGRAFQSTAGQ